MKDISLPQSFAGAGDAFSKAPPAGSGAEPPQGQGTESLASPAFLQSSRLLSFVRRAVDDYEMIAPGDKIMVGLSGGKDSAALLAAMIELRRFYPIPFDVCACTIDMGFEGGDTAYMADFCAIYGVEFRAVKTNIAHVVFDVKKEKNPCSLCARMRRGALHGAAQEMGANKLALGHHFDDVVDTFMLALMHEGRIGTLSPVTYLDRRDLTMIRPLIYMPEKDIQYFVRRNPGLPIRPSLCPEDKHTERETVKQLLDQLDHADKGLKHRIFGAIQKAGVDGFKESGHERRSYD